MRKIFLFSLLALGIMSNAPSGYCRTITGDEYECHQHEGSRLSGTLFIAEIGTNSYYVHGSGLGIKPATFSFVDYFVEGDVSHYVLRNSAYDFRFSVQFRGSQQITIFTFTSKIHGGTTIFVSNKSPIKSQRNI